MSAAFHSGVALLERATHVARSQTDLPDHTSAIIGMLGLTIIEMIQRSPDDLAEQLAQIAVAARRT